LPEWVTLAAQEVHTLGAKLDVAHADSRGPKDEKAAIDVGRAQAMIEVGVGGGPSHPPRRWEGPPFAPERESASLKPLRLSLGDPQRRIRAPHMEET